MSDRNEFIDFLRFVGLALIIFAHVKAPYILFQLRNFDVPLMVIVSAMSFSLSYKADQSYLSYVWSRFKRLVFPTWIFLTLFLLGVAILDPTSDKLNIYKIIDSFFLFEGIGYVWAIRVFLLVALAAPFWYRLHLKIKSDLHYIAILLSTYLIYELCLFYSMPYLDIDVYKYLSYIFYYIIPYSILFALGIRMPKLTPRSNSIIIGISLITFIVLGALLFYENGYLTPTWHHKYPPSGYYISFALLGCMFCWLTGAHLWNLIRKIRALKSIILFMAQNSLWIFLWHIPFVEYIDKFFIIEYIIAMSAATLITYLQVYLIKNIILPGVSNRNLQYNIKMILTG